MSGPSLLRHRLSRSVSPAVALILLAVGTGQPRLASAQAASQRLREPLAVAALGTAGGALPDPLQRFRNPAALADVRGLAATIGALAVDAIDQGGVYGGLSGRIASLGVAVDVREQHINEVFDDQLVQAGLAPENQYVGDLGIRATIARSIGRAAVGVSVERLDSRVLGNAGSAWAFSAGGRIRIRSGVFLGGSVLGAGSAFHWRSRGGRAHFPAEPLLDVHAAWLSDTTAPFRLEMVAAASAHIRRSIDAQVTPSAGVRVARGPLSLSGGITRADVLTDPTLRLSAGLGLEFGRLAVAIVREDITADLAPVTHVQLRYLSRK